MLLGKRQRRPATVRRTTSLTDLSFDVNTAEGERCQRPALGTEGVTGDDRVNNSRSGGRRQQQRPHHVGHQKQQPDQGLLDGYLSLAPPAPAPRNLRRHSADFVMQQAHFLRACGLCKQGLGPGKDTFIYRGEVAFCSLECRQQQMNLDEKKDKYSLASMKRVPPQPGSKPEASSDGETVLAA